MSGIYEQVYAIVRLIPSGRVLTYGLISHLLNRRLSAQGVGWALKALAGTHSTAIPPKPKIRSVRGGELTASVRQPESSAPTSVPWHRVINSTGGLSTAKNPDIPPGLQRQLLEQEGIVFDKEERIDLTRFLWHDGLKTLSRLDA